MDWIWSPFQAQEPDDSALPIIVGRVADRIAHIVSDDIPQPRPKMDPRLIIPLCGIELREQVTLPNVLTDRAEFFLELSEITAQEEDAIQEEVLNLLGGTHQTYWNLISGLNPLQQLDLLARLIRSPRLPLQEDWQYLDKYVKYTFKSGWHYRCVLTLSLLFSISALFMIGVILISQVKARGILGLAMIVIVIFWINLLQGIEESWEPNTFLRFGFKGIQTFDTEIRRFLTDHLVWGGVKLLFRTLNLTGNRALMSSFFGAIVLSVFGAFVTPFLGAEAEGAIAIFGAVAVAFLGALVGVWAGSGAISLALALSFVGAVVVAFSGGISLALSLSVFVAGALVMVLALVKDRVFVLAIMMILVVIGALFAIVFVGRVITVSEFMTGAITGALAGISGYGVSVWGQGDMHHMRYMKVLSLCTFPFFCWFPITLVFSTLGLLHALPKNIFSLPVTILFMSCIVGLCVGLWKRGNYLDRRARNPFQGILHEKPSPLLTL